MKVIQSAKDYKSEMQSNSNCEYCICDVKSPKVKVKIRGH